jgi:hypothetical protein
VLVLLGVQLLAQIFGNRLQMHKVAEAAARALAHFIISATSLIEIMVLSEDIIFRLFLYIFYKNQLPLESW